MKKLSVIVHLQQISEILFCMLFYSDATFGNAVPDYRYPIEDLSIYSNR
jgi:hypothetical protein